MKLTPAQIISKQESLKQARHNWENHWQDCAELIIPRKNFFIRRNVAGEKKGIQLFDNTAMVSCESLVAALHGLLTNPNTLWFLLQTGDTELDDRDDITEYLQELTRRMHRVLNNSNFQPEIYEYFLDLCAFGTAAMTVEEDEDTLVRFSAKHLSGLFVDENSLGFIDEAYRVFKWTARNLIEKFASGVGAEDYAAMEKILGDKVVSAFKQGSSQKFEVVHAVYRDKITENPNMPYISQYILKSPKRQLSEGRFRQFPYIVSRWSKTSEEIYGRSPGMTALPEAKTLNVMAKTMIMGAQKIVDPPVQMPDDGFVRPLRTQPGGVNYYRAGSNDRVEPIFNDSRIDFGFEAMRERQLRVREAFFVDKLNLVQSDRMTTVEVNQRIQEQLRFLGPLLGRQQVEFLRPLVDRIIDIMVRNDKDGSLIGQPPEELADRELDVIYSSPVARAQRAGEADALRSAMAGAAPAFELNPESVDVIDGDEYVKLQFKIQGADQRVLRSKEEVEAVREARQAAQQAALDKQEQLQNSEQVKNVAPILKG